MLKLGIGIAAVLVVIGCSDDASNPGGGGTGNLGGNAMGGSPTGGNPNGGSPNGGGGTGGNPNGGGGGTGGGTGGGNCDTISDSFDDASTLGCWSLLHVAENATALHDTLDIDMTAADHLVIEPRASGWFRDDRGPFMFKTVSGSFVAEVHAAAVDESNASIPPTADFHSAGLLIRDAAGTPGDENWVMYNVGHQGVQSATTGTEGKTTVDSQSTLIINQGAHVGLLRLCRVGDDVYLLKQLEGENDWTQEHQFARADLPDEVQLGVIVNAWPPGSPSDARNIQARFRDYRFGAVTDIAGCTADITPQ